MGFALSGIARARRRSDVDLFRSTEFCSIHRIGLQLSSIQPMAAVHQPMAQARKRSMRPASNTMTPSPLSKAGIKPRMLHSDPKFDALDAAATDAKSRYDNEIDDALSVISWNDEYQDLIPAAGARAEARK